MTSSRSPITGATSPAVDEDTAARIALTCAGVSGEPSVAIGIQLYRGAARFVGAVHDGEDSAAALSNIVRQRIRGLATASKVIRTLEAAQAHGVGILTPAHEFWPTQLSALRGGAPLFLWVRGDAQILTQRSIALTGSSAPTDHGVLVAAGLSVGLAERDWGIAAGGGSGIDPITLHGAEVMGGRSIVVAAPGLDRLHPGRTHQVQVSEFPPAGQLTLRGQRRAKCLLAALADKTIIVEAGLSSGALRVAEAAHALSRPLGVVPGSATDPFSAGCELLAHKHGATLITSIDHADRLS